MDIEEGLRNYSIIFVTDHGKGIGLLAIAPRTALVYEVDRFSHP